MINISITTQLLFVGTMRTLFSFFFQVYSCSKFQVCISYMDSESPEVTHHVNESLYLVTTIPTFPPFIPHSHLSTLLLSSIFLDYISKTISISLCIWLISFSIMHHRFTHVIKDGTIFPFSKAFNIVQSVCIHSHHISTLYYSALDRHKLFPYSGYCE